MFINSLRYVVQENWSVTIVLCALSQDGNGPHLSITATGDQQIVGPEQVVL